jgi:hypothetical protein
MVEISLSGSGEGPGRATAPGYSTGPLVSPWTGCWSGTTPSEPLSSSRFSDSRLGHGSGFTREPEIPGPSAGGSGSDAEPKRQAVLQADALAASPPPSASKSFFTNPWTDPHHPRCPGSVDIFLGPVFWYGLDRWHSGRPAVDTPEAFTCCSGRRVGLDGPSTTASSPTWTRSAEVFGRGGSRPRS